MRSIDPESGDAAPHLNEAVDGPRPLRRRYLRPAVTFRQRLEAVAAICSGPLNTGKTAFPCKIVQS